VNDLQPPLLALLTNRVSAGRPTLALRVLDLGSGVDPFSLVVGYGRVLVAAAAYDPATGVAIFPIPRDAPALKAGKPRLDASAADFQESKNVDSIGDELLPNTAFASGPITVVNGPAVTWLQPEISECIARQAPLAVLAASTAAVRSVRFLAGTRQVGVDRRGGAGIYSATWRRGAIAGGRYKLRAIVTDARGRTALAERVVRVCR
jgi:hypothetical protein